MPNLNNFVNPQFPEIGWDEQEQVQPHDNVQGMQHPPFVIEQVQDQIMEVEDELEVEEEQEEMVQPVVQESHQFNDSALINSSSSEGSVNTGAVPQQLVINRIEVQFEVLGKDLTSLLDRVFPAYTNFMQSCVVGPVLPKDMVLDKVYKGLVPVLFMNTIPSVWPAHKFDWITKSMP
jgi:hypothetical protein